MRRWTTRHWLQKCMDCLLLALRYGSHTSLANCLDQYIIGVVQIREASAFCRFEHGPQDVLSGYSFMSCAQQNVVHATRKSGLTAIQMILHVIYACGGVLQPRTIDQDTHVLHAA